MEYEIQSFQNSHPKTIILSLDGRKPTKDNCLEILKVIKQMQMISKNEIQPDKTK